jgi:hypothetical protein
MRTAQSRSIALNKSMQLAGEEQDREHVIMKGTVLMQSPFFGSWPRIRG